MKFFYGDYTLIGAVYLTVSLYMVKLSHMYGVTIIIYRAFVQLYGPVVKVLGGATMLCAEMAVIFLLN